MIGLLEKLHLGHWVGSIKNRVALQDQYECFFLIADLHTLTTKPTKAEILEMRQHITEAVLDWLACGIDPTKSTIYLQSAVPEIYELNLIFEMLVFESFDCLPSIKRWLVMRICRGEYSFWFDWVPRSTDS